MRRRCDLVSLWRSRRKDIDHVICIVNLRYLSEKLTNSASVMALDVLGRDLVHKFEIYFGGGNKKLLILTLYIDPSQPIQNEP